MDTMTKSLTELVRSKMPKGTEAVHVDAAVALAADFAPLQLRAQAGEDVLQEVNKTLLRSASLPHACRNAVGVAILEWCKIPDRTA